MQFIINDQLSSLIEFF